MQTYSELREQALEFYQKIDERRVFVPDMGYERMPYTVIKEIKDEFFPDFPVAISDTFIIEGPLLDQTYGNWEYGETSFGGLEFLTNPQNRLRLIYWKGMLNAYANDTETRPAGAGSNQHVMWARGVSSYGYDDTRETAAMFVLRKFAEVRPSIDELKNAKFSLQRWVEIVQARVNIVKNETEQGSGLNKILTEGPSGGREFTLRIEEQIKTLSNQLPSNGLASRTWGFEIESPDCKGVEPLPFSGIDKGDDGSLRSYEGSEDCECYCSDCTYHECNCDNCSDYNDSPDHCGSGECTDAESAEYRSTGGIQRVKHNGMYDLCQKLLDEGAEMNDTAGTHIHVWAGDLTTMQVGTVMATYKRLEGLFSVLCGRNDVQYARRVSIEHIRFALSKKDPKLKAEKPRAVNVSHLLNDRGTIEFRQMDCNYNADKITFFAWVVRGLIETAKRGATMQSFFKVMDFYDLVNVFGKYNYFLASETPGLVVPGTKTDSKSVEKVTHRVA
jgi:hypothetical protein